MKTTININILMREVTVKRSANLRSSETLVENTKSRVIS